MTELRSQFNSDEDDQLSEEDCQSRCFICAKHLSVQNTEEDYIRNHSIKTICKYLKINQDKNKLVDFVPFCENCYKIFTKLSNYCSDLEVLQMKIGYFLNQLNQLTVVDNEPLPRFSAFNKARKQLKSKFVKKCISNNQAGPFVIIPNLEVEHLASPVYLSDVDFEPEEESDCEMVENSDDQYSSSDVEDNDSEFDPSSPSSENKPKVSGSKRPQSSSSLQKLDKLSTSSSQKTFPCLECGQNFKCKDSLREHLPLYHPETYFPSEPKTNKSSSSTSVYKMYLTHLLNTEVESCGSFKTGFNCAYCPKTFKNKRRLAVRLHLVLDHQDNLLENLTILQTAISPDQLSKIVKMPGQQYLKTLDHQINSKLKQFCKTKKRMKPEHTCSLCQVRTTSLRKHEALHHPEKFLLPKRLPNVPLEQFKLYCSYLINKQVEDFTKFIEKSTKSRFSCPYCPNSYGDIQGCRNHLVLGHVQLLLVEIEKLQENVQPEELKELQKQLNLKAKYYIRSRSTKKINEVATMKCNICDVRLTQRSMTLHMKKSHPDEYANNYSCEICVICGKSFRSKWWLDYHRCSSHADVIFGKWRNFKTSGEDFRKMCDILIEKEIKSLERIGKVVEGKFRWRCEYCGKTYGDKIYVNIHLVFDHMEILGGKLEVEQNKKNGEWEEMDGLLEPEVGIKMEEEEGGAGNVEDFEETEVFCEKSVVKKEFGDMLDDNDGINGLEAIFPD